MSTTVSLNVNASVAQTSVATATLTVDGASFDAPITWASSDETVATARGGASNGQALVTAVRDPSGPSTRTATITASATVNGAPVTGSGVATVITTADNVSLTIDFATPTP